MKSLICLLVLLSSTTSFSISPSDKDFQKFGRWWKRVEIPGAKCGNGKPYAVWVDKADKKRSVLSSWVVVPAGQKRRVMGLILNHGFFPYLEFP